MFSLASIFPTYLKIILCLFLIYSLEAESRANLGTEPATKNNSHATGVMFNLGEVMRYKSE